MLSYFLCRRKYAGSYGDYIKVFQVEMLKAEMMKERY